jgi:excinuclease ABC subunit C
MAKHIWQDKVALEDFLKKNTLPETPGVYFFLDEKKSILYIGKATSLRDRVRSYFTQDVATTRGPKIELTTPQIASIAYQRVDSVLEALLLESELIKKYQPVFNTDAKDDKSYNRVVITKEAFPRVLLVRERELHEETFILPIRKIFGPFPQGSDLRAALKIIRKLFPFRDTCTPYANLSAEQKKKSRECFSSQIGLCPGVCKGAIEARVYQKNIRHIELFFAGKKGRIIQQLEKDMHALAQERRFEEAHEKKKLLFGLQHIQDIALVTEDRQTEDRHRIEAYDVAHLRGTASVGVMTVVQKGRVVPGEYRQFILRKNHNGNDLTALAEVLERRLRHPEWPYPEIMIVDGDERHRRVASEVLEKVASGIPVLAVTKDARHRAKSIVGETLWRDRFEKEILLANTEAHRFALTFHKKKRGQAFLSPSSRR